MVGGMGFLRPIDLIELFDQHDGAAICWPAWGTEAEDASRRAAGFKRSPTSGPEVPKPDGFLEWMQAMIWMIKRQIDRRIRTRSRVMTVAFGAKGWKRLCEFLPDTGRKDVTVQRRDYHAECADSGETQFSGEMGAGASRRRSTR